MNLFSDFQEREANVWDLNQFFNNLQIKYVQIKKIKYLNAFQSSV